MNELNRKAGYLNGLLHSCKDNIPETAAPIVEAIADLLNALTEKVTAQEILLSDLNDYVESIDDDLSALEENGPEGYPFDEDSADFGESDQLRVIDGGAAPGKAAGAHSYTGCVCPKCAALFVTDTADRPGSKYPCPVCGAVVVPEPLSAENIRPVAPVRE